jgi:hypothetical protein
MTVRGRILGTVAAVALATLACACQGRGDDCAVGSEGCACTAAGRCDDPLSCTDGVCSSSSGGGPATASGGAPPGSSGGPPSQSSGGATAGPLGFSEADTASIQPMPATEFVFQRLVKQRDDLVSHIYAFDLATRTERLISKLDQDIGRGDEIRQMAVSADRRWIAFSSVLFRISDEDYFKYFFFQDVLWALSADGKMIRRLTKPPVGPLNVVSGSTCVSDSQCVDSVCRMNRCELRNYNIQYEHIAWAPDGKSVVYGEQQSWLGGPFGLVSGTSLAAVSISGGQKQTMSGPLPSGCLATTPLDFHPLTGALLVSLVNCFSMPAAGGFYEWGVNPFVRQRMLTREPVLSSVISRTTEWLADGSAFVFVAKEKRYGLYQWESSPMPRYGKIYEPPTEDIDVVDFGISKAEDVVVHIQQKVPGVENRFFHQLHLLDNDTHQLTQLPIPGLVKMPRF